MWGLWEQEREGRARSQKDLYSLSPFKAKSQLGVFASKNMHLCVACASVGMFGDVCVCASIARSSSDPRGHASAANVLFIRQVQMEFYPPGSERPSIWKLFKYIHCTYSPCGNVSCEINIYPITSLLTGNSKALTSSSPTA